MQTIWAFALFALCAGRQAANTLGINAGISVSSDIVDARNVVGIKAFIGDGKEAANISQMFEPNFGRKETIIGEFETAKWGITCADTTDKTTNTCVVDKDASEKEDYYFNNRFQFKDAKLNLRFFTDEKFETANVEKLPIRLATSSNLWPLNKVGVIGLSPNSDFGKYMKSAYDGNNSLMLGYQIDKLTASNKIIKFDPIAMVNPNYGEGHVFSTITVDKESEFWTAVADVTIGNSDINYKSTPLCFTSIANDLILVGDSIVQCDQVRAAICPEGKNLKCNKDEAKMDKAPTITIQIGNAVSTITGEQYIYFDDKNNLSCRFGDLSEYSGDRVCPDGTKVAVGRTFFSIYFPLIVFTNDKPTMKLLYSYKFVDPSPPHNNTDNSNIFIILGIIAAIIVTGLIVYFFIRKRNNAQDNDENYANL